MTRLERLQQAAIVVAVAAALLGFLASVGKKLLPPLAGSLAPFLHTLFLVAGASAGWVADRRHREIERRRWQVVEDPQLTSGEREWAHKEAERERRVAHTAFLLAPLFLAYWLAYQFSPGSGLFAGALPVSALAGYGLGWFVAGRKRPQGEDQRGADS